MNKKKFFIIGVFFLLFLLAGAKKVEAILISSSGVNPNPSDTEVTISVNGGTTGTAQFCQQFTSPPYGGGYIYWTQVRDIEDVWVSSGVFSGPLNVQVTNDGQTGRCVNGSADTGSPETFYAEQTFSTASLANGTYSITISARDSSGQVNTRSVVFDVYREDPETCQIPGATNIGAQGDCEFPPETCQEAGATNIGGPSPCQFETCQVAGATNIGDPLPCEFPPDECSINSFTADSGGSISSPLAQGTGTTLRFTLSGSFPWSVTLASGSVNPNPPTSATGSSGSVSTGNLTATQTYKLTCGNSTLNKTVYVEPPSGGGGEYPGNFSISGGCYAYPNTLADVGLASVPSDTTSYDLERSINSGGWEVVWNNISSTGSINDVNHTEAAVNGATYNWRVKAKNSVGSKYSNNILSYGINSQDCPSSSEPPPQTCQDPEANNNGGSLPCVYPPDSSCVDNSSVSFVTPLPSTLSPGENRDFTVRVTNTGGTWWYHGGAYNFSQKSALTISPSYGHLPYRPETGEYVDWAFTLVAPTTPNTYTLNMQMLHNAGWDYTKTIGGVCAPGPASATYFGSTASKTFTVTGDVTTCTDPDASNYGSQGSCTYSNNNPSWSCTASVTPSSGNAPLNNVDVTINGVGDNASLNSVDCTNDGVYDRGWGGDGGWGASTAYPPVYTYADVCSYAANGNYTLKVKREQLGGNGEIAYCSAGVTVGDSVPLTIVGNPSPGGKIASFDNKINCGTQGSASYATCTALYSEGAVTTLSAVPSSSYWQFSGWNTGVAGECTGVGLCTLNITAPKTVTATFTVRPFSYIEF